MATYRRASRLVPSAQRHTVVTEVEAGDQINFVDILGRPARRIKIVPDDATDEITIRVNNRVRIPQRGEDDNSDVFREIPNSVYVVSDGAQHPAYVLTGDTSYYTEEELRVSFVSIIDITFGSGGTSITIYAW